MKFIRIFWGDVKRYKRQILNCHRVNEVVYVFGKDNQEFFVDKGFETVLLSDDSYDISIASDHTFKDHSSLIHKLVALDAAVKKYGEVIFLDWDCYKVRDIDDNFFTFLKEGNAFQVPLYVYPKTELTKLCESDLDTEYGGFFNKLKSYLDNLSYEFRDSYVIPNTGFIYCRSSDISSKLVTLAKDNKLETVPDELAVMLMFKDLTLNEYIHKVEPNVIFGKHHQTNSDWNECQLQLNDYISNQIRKQIYFHHV